MKKVFLTPLLYKGAWQISVKFPFDLYISSTLKKLKIMKWSNHHGCYYAPWTAENKRLIYSRLRVMDVFVDYSEIQNFAIPIKQEPVKQPVFSRKQKKVLHEYVAYLRGQRLSESSVRTYYNFVLKLVDHVGERPYADLKPRDIELFIEQRIAAENYALSTHRQCISAIKHFFDLYTSESIDTSEIKRPHKSRYLPTVLAKEEVISLLRVTRNLKHRAILAMIYSGGLRIGELLELKLAHIDVMRRQIMIKNSKGRKDRVVVLAESMLPLLNNYLMTYMPKEYFTEGQAGGPYSAQSIRTFLQESCRRAGIRKKVTPHTLRHSYATHMLENGIDLRYIQELLGHSKPETTMIYTHVSRKDILKIESPLDVTLKELFQTDKREENLLLSRQYKR
ncbi:tyrosine-type recombinase/integrase [Salinimicrobium oceani]|uniref:Tyrosine-type recombinase/integrase n=1 Tax=Salinimicrobium oceani TaxID=2722702 RepID=A0ABX1D1U6_9FLAO|nr:tyrosine-type recombinase/integrase [Salinimicrobium oceani]NJW53639.1 tyrosine-type recombinase/integrase [Salinimicrobium oceani]